MRIRVFEFCKQTRKSFKLYIVYVICANITGTTRTRHTHTHTLKQQNGSTLKCDILIGSSLLRLMFVCSYASEVDIILVEEVDWGTLGAIHTSREPHISPPVRRDSEE